MSHMSTSKLHELSSTFDMSTILGVLWYSKSHSPSSLNKRMSG